MLILGLDTTQPTVQISLLGESQKIFVGEQFTNKMESLPGLLKRLFESYDLQPQALTAIGIISGPGNYTGIRAGMMVVKTLTYRYQIPLYGLSKLEAALYSLRSLNMPLSPIFHVRQGQIYTGLGQWQAGQANYQVEPCSKSLPDWFNQLAEQGLPALFCRSEPFEGEWPNERAWLPLGNLAGAVADWTHEQVKGGHPPKNEVAPFYIRPAVQMGAAQVPPAKANPN